VADTQIDAQLAVLLHSLTTMRTPEPGFSFAELRKAEPVVVEQTIMDVVFKELCRQVGCSVHADSCALVQNVRGATCGLQCRRGP
jgi:hypothetical protein